MIFPFIQPQATQETTELELYREIKWAFKEDRPIFKNGKPVIVTGNEAAKVWVWNALQTVRRRYVIYTYNYGNDIEELVGQPYSDDVKILECRRYLKECLMINPYITDVTDIQVDFSKHELEVCCKVHTIYGTFTIGGEDGV